MRSNLKHLLNQNLIQSFCHLFLSTLYYTIVNWLLIVEQSFVNWLWERSIQVFCVNFTNLGGIIWTSADFSVLKFPKVKFFNCSRNFIRKSWQTWFKSAFRISCLWPFVRHLLFVSCRLYIKKSFLYDIWFGVNFFFLVEKHLPFILQSRNRKYALESLMRWSSALILKLTMIKEFKLI